MILTSEAEARAFVANRCVSEALEKLDLLVGCLKDASDTQNLVSRPSLDNVWLRHIADSAQLLDHVPRETSLWLDLGSGAGFPGLVVATIQPERPVVLVESRKLRIRWLGEMIALLALRNCRVEGRDVRKMDDIEAAVISARAFAPLDRLVAFSARFSTSATTWVLPKGRSAEQEVQNLPASLQQMFHVKQSVTDHEAGIVVGRGKVELTG